MRNRLFFGLVLAAGVGGIAGLYLLAKAAFQAPGSDLVRARSATMKEQRFFDWTSLQFSPEVHWQRRRKLIAILREVTDGIFLSPARDGFSDGTTFRQNDDFLYFTGLELPNSMLVVDVANETTQLFVPPRDLRFESSSRPNDFPGRRLGEDPELARRSGIREIRDTAELESALSGWVEEGRPLLINRGRPGELESVEPSLLSPFTPVMSLLYCLQRKLPKAPIQNVFDAVAELRSVKSPEEIDLIRRACEITAAGIRAAARVIRTGVDERSLEAEFEATCKRLGSQRLAFSSIIKSGPNSLWPWRILAAHYDRRNRKMVDGDLVIFDVGCELNGYASDVGRTFPVSGRFTEDQARRLRMITRVSDTVIASIRPGITFAELQEIAVAEIPEGERSSMQAGLFFGHPIGLNVGDPRVRDAPLRAGMIFTVEPWYYDHEDEIAVFVEDNILVTGGGAESLTASLPRSPEDLEGLMRGE